MNKALFLLTFIIQINLLCNNKNLFNLKAPNDFDVKKLNLRNIDLKKPIIFDIKPIYKIKKDVLIFTSNGGGGHTAVANALKDYLKDRYNIKIVNFFSEVMSSLDTVRNFTFGKISSEDFYNFCLKYRFIKLVNVFTTFGSWVLNSKYYSIEKAAYNFINKNIPKPDLIISVIPMVNNVILSASKKLNIPFLVVTNDLNTINYINGIEKVDYSKFYYTLPFRDKDIVKIIENINIPKDQLFFSGFPLRPDFFNKKRDKNSVFKDFNIPKNKNKVMILMGGTGSYITYKYIKTLSKYKKPIHIIACLGKNENIAKSIDNIRLPKHITLSKIGFTDRIADLMSVSQVIITKSGPGSICEAIASGLPMIIDKTAEIIKWEKLNIDFVEKYKLGTVLYDIKNLNKEVEKILSNKKYRVDIKKNISKLNHKLAFKDNIINIVNDITTCFKIT